VRIAASSTGCHWQAVINKKQAVAVEMNRFFINYLLLFSYAMHEQDEELFVIEREVFLLS